MVPYRDIVCVITRPAIDDPALQTAKALAAANDAHVAALVPAFTPMLPAAAPGALMPELYADLASQAHKAARARAADVATSLQAAGVTGDARVIDIDVSGLGDRARRHSWYADLTVIDAATADEQPGLAEQLAADLLFGSGRPLLIVPHGRPLALPIKKALIAWAPSAQSARAVHDALPLLAGAEVNLITIDADASFGPEPGADIAAHLARHGLTITVTHVASGSDSIGEAILREAGRMGADLIVMGGYGHARWKEMILGGATRDVLRFADRPILMAH
jgi:nucleotide-binding universal stress UspA family protein